MILNILEKKFPLSNQFMWNHAQCNLSSTWYTHNHENRITLTICTNILCSIYTHELAHELACVAFLLALSINTKWSSHWRHKDYSTKATIYGRTLMKHHTKHLAKGQSVSRKVPTVANPGVHAQCSKLVNTFFNMSIGTTAISTWMFSSSS